MSIAIFNTAKFQEKLIEAKVDPNVAKAQAEVLYEAFAENVDKLATKERMDERFDNVDIRFDALNKELGDMKKDMNARFDSMSKDMDRRFSTLRHDMQYNFAETTKLFKEHTVEVASHLSLYGKEIKSYRNDIASDLVKYKYSMLKWMLGISITVGLACTSIVLGAMYFFLNNLPK